MSTLDRVKHFIGQNAPTILTIMSCAGVVGTAICAGQDALKARDVLLQAEMNNEDLSKREGLMRVAPCYISTALMASATVACIISNHQVSTGKIAAYASAYSLAQAAAKEYRDKVVDIIGEKKAKDIDDAIADKHMAEHPASKQPIVVGDGQVLCYDNLSGRYFSSDMESLRKIVNDLNFDLMSDMWVRLNEFYDRIGLDPINLGEELGWSVDHQIELKFSSRLTDNGKPCLVVDFYTMPMADTERRY